MYAFQHGIIASSNSGGANPLWDGLLAYYTADNTVNDALGTYNGTLVNGATYGTGKINQGFDLDGVNDYVSIPSGTFNPSGDYTISQWINSEPIASNSSRGIFFVGGNLTTNTISVYLFNNAGTTYIRLINSNNSTFQLIQSTIPSFNNFHHIAGIKNTTDNKYYLYVNGVLVSQDTITVNFVPISLSTTIGSLGPSYASFLGKIDEVGLWDRALTPTEVTELYNSGAALQYPL